MKKVLRHRISALAAIMVMLVPLLCVTPVIVSAMEFSDPKMTDYVSLVNRRISDITPNGVTNFAANGLGEVGSPTTFDYRGYASYVFAAGFSPAKSAGFYYEDEDGVIEGAPPFPAPANNPSGTVVIQTMHGVDGNNPDWGGNFSFNMYESNNNPITIRQHKFKSDMQIWEINVKMPVLTGGNASYRDEAYVDVLGFCPNNFYGTIHPDAQALRISKGGVKAKVYNDAGTNLGWTSEIVEEDQLEEGKWYRIVRVLDFSVEKRNKHQVFVYDAATGALKGSTEGWEISGLQPSPNNYAFQFWTIGCYSRHFPSNTVVQYKDLKGYAIPHSVSEIKVGGQGEKAFALNAGTNMNISAAGNYNYRAYGAKEHFYSVEVNVPSTNVISSDGINSRVDLFNLSYSGDLTLDALDACVVIEGDKMYGNYKNGYLNSGTTTSRFEVYKAGTEDPLIIDPNTWYKVEVEQKQTLAAGVAEWLNLVHTNRTFSISVYNEAGVKIGERNNIVKNTSVPNPAPVPPAASPRDENYRNDSVSSVLGVVSAIGYDRPVLFRNYNGENWVDKSAETKPNPIPALSTPMDSYALGDNFMISPTNSGAGVIINTLRGAAVVLTEPPTNSYLYTGVAESNILDPITITFNMDIDSATFNNTNIKLEMVGEVHDMSSYYNLAYDSITKVGTISFVKPLPWDSDYELTIGKEIQSRLFGETQENGQFSVPLAYERKFTFSTPIRPPGILVEHAEIKLDSNTTATAPIAQNAKLKASVSLTNVNTNSATPNVTLMLAVYNDNKLVGVALKDITVPANANNQLFETEQLVTVPTTGCRAKLFLWDGLTDMEPVLDEPVTVGP